MARGRVEAVCPTCGETWTWSVDCYKRRDADEWEAKHEGEERECPACYAETRKRMRAEKGKETAERVSAMVAKVGKEFRKLEGTEKQVAWAETLRAEFLLGVVRENPSAKLEIVDVVNLETTARFWIDQREMSRRDALGALWVLHEDECAAILGTG